jgi:phosphoribosylformylglycinamidine synthase
VRFDDEFDVCFKVETHNHPSAIEPYGGAGTGIGGVIRDILGTGLGARPIANTDVFCFGDLDTEELPKGVLHPLRIMKGVVAGVRDYGNRMGIPTVNGAVCFDERYLGNPIVYCGTVGIIPRGMSEKAARPGDRIVAVGGRTGRDGIHGATFSSEPLHDESDVVSSGAVQIGNAIEEKRTLDCLLRARDRGLFTAVTDCGAAGFSSAVGEMGEEIGAEVWLERAPLKYEGLNPVEIWISEAQERMVLSVPPEHEEEVLALFAAEDVEATVIGEFNDTRRLLVKHGDQVIVDLGMEFLHQGLPKTPRKATWTTPAIAAPAAMDEKARLLDLLRDGNVCSKEWIVRQYDHEVQAGSAIKPLVGPEGRGPGDAAVVVPVLGQRRGVVIGSGINPHYGDLDPYHMAMCCVDEAIRNVVAVGADPARIALLDNFSWGDCKNPETLGAMVRAARGCRDAALLFEAPFISGKDSLNNEYRTETGSIRIPHTLLVSALGQVDDVARCATSDLKRSGSKLVLVGETHDDPIPQVRPGAPQVMREVATAIRQGKVLACHDLAEGGLAVAATEMAIGGGFGVRIQTDTDLFNESPSRFLLEVENDLGIGRVIGEVVAEPVVDLGSFHLDLGEARDAFFWWEKLL